MRLDDGHTDEVAEHLASALAGLTSHPERLSAAARQSNVRDRDVWLRLFDAQLASRHADRAARWMQGQGRGYYTIGSAGHESNAAVAAALRPTDPALLHYRSGAFYLARSGQLDRADGVRDILLGVAASADEPMSGGRHKVFGHPDLNIIPQTSTIASHVPRAFGVALAIERARKVAVPSRWPDDAITVCSLGDASVNHSTAIGGLNAVSYAAFQGIPVPLLFVCEDNGIGISTPTPVDWVRAAHAGHPGMRYVAADGFDLADTLAVARQATEWVRSSRRPAFLHLRTVRLMGHAGSDVEAAYRPRSQILADRDRDPIIGTAQLLADSGVLTVDAIVERDREIARVVMALAQEVLSTPQLTTRQQVTAPLLLPGSPGEALRAADVSATVVRGAAPSVRRRGAFVRPPEDEGLLTLAQTINRALADILVGQPDTLVFGEDVARKGGVYGVTRGLVKMAGPARVFDTVLDEQTVLGLALGAAISGFVPIPEIQYLAYLHNAEDQLRGEAASLAFFADRQFLNPMVVRIAAYAYQKGFGGHFHNDNSVAVLRDLPGVIVASPSHPADAAPMLRTCVASARADGRVCVFLEPIALYHVKDLHAPGDNGWLARYADPATWGERHVPVGRAVTHGGGRDLTIVTFGNGTYLSRRVAARLHRDGIGARVVDLRWLAPLPVEDVLREARVTGRVLVVDETRRSGGVADALVASLVQADFRGRTTVVAAEDSFIPLGPAAEQVLVTEQEVEDRARALAAARPEGGPIDLDR